MYPGRRFKRWILDATWSRPAPDKGMLASTFGVRYQHARDNIRLRLRLQTMYRGSRCLGTRHTIRRGMLSCEVASWRRGGVARGWANKIDAL